MSKFKKATSAFDRQKIAAYKEALRAKEAENAKPEGYVPKTFYVTSGPHLYISKMLNQKGALSVKEIWHEYTRDQQAKTDEVLRSLTYLKQKIIPTMVEQRKIEKTGFSQVRQKFFGYKLNPKYAFKHVHPEIVASLDPPVDVTPRRPRQAADGSINIVTRASRGASTEEVPQTTVEK